MSGLANSVASTGIGACIATNLAAAGASVVVNYASAKEEADLIVAGIIDNGGKAIAVQGNVSNSSDVSRLFAETIKTFGAVDILVNNAGVFKFAPLEFISEEDFRYHFNTNVLGVLLTTQEAVKCFNEAGGSIVNIGSLVSTISPAGTAVYSASKGAVDVITKVLSKELGPKKIRVNSINPGMVNTEGTRSAGIIGSDFEVFNKSLSPLDRIGQPEDIAMMALFLASEDSRWLTGEMLLAGGGVR
jgi:3-oxoacyl-[acyl-carrier protein] reductase